MGHQYTYFESEDYIFRVHEVQGVVFLHMQMLRWTPEVLKDIKSRAKTFLETYRSRGYERVFATCDNEMTIKFWNMVRPCEVVKPFGEHNEYWIGSWLTGE